MREAAVVIGGACLSVRSVDPSLRVALSSAQSRFACSPATTPDIELTIGRHPGPDRPRGRLIFHSGGIWQLFAAGEDLVFSLETPAFGPRPYRTARLDRDLRRGHIEVHEADPAGRAPDACIEPLEYPLDELVVMHWLSRGRGVELHACGIVDDDGLGLIFCGQSGAGKTTTARLWSANRAIPAVVLSDDRIIVRSDGGRLYMYGTPWHGEAELAAAERVPVKGVFLLEQSTETSLGPLSVTEAVTRLLACSFLPFHDPAAIGNTVDLLARLASAVPVQAMRFRRDQGFVDLVRRATR